MISAEKARFPVSLQCELLGVSRLGYYERLRGGPSDREIADELLTAKIREIHKRARGVYGARRVHAELRLGSRHKGVQEADRAPHAPGRYLRFGDPKAR